ncbi:MAG: HEAT repeat domain-containing protein [Acidobacteriota bacterium]
METGRNELKMYRGKDMGDREKLINTCLEILSRGNPNELYDILPHISLVRSPAFMEALVQLLHSGDRDQKEFAALGLGSLGKPNCIEDLLEVFMRPETFKGTGSQSLQTAIIIALGEIGDEAAVQPLIRIYDLSFPQDQFSLRRKRLVLSSLGTLAQQGSVKAEQELLRLMKHKHEEVRAQAVTELATAYWHRAGDIPDELLQQICGLTEESSEEVRKAALSSLSNLADLGCESAEEFLKTVNSEK